MCTHTACRARASSCLSPASPWIMLVAAGAYDVAGNGGVDVAARMLHKNEV